MQPISTPVHLPEGYTIISHYHGLGFGVDWWLVKEKNISGTMHESRFTLERYNKARKEAWQHYHVGLICQVILGVE